MRASFLRRFCNTVERAHIDEAKELIGTRWRNYEHDGHGAKAGVDIAALDTLNPGIHWTVEAYPLNMEELMARIGQRYPMEDFTHEAHVLSDGLAFLGLLSICFDRFKRSNQPNVVMDIGRILAAYLEDRVVVDRADFNTYEIFDQATRLISRHRDTADANTQFFCDMLHNIFGSRRQTDWRPRITDSFRGPDVCSHPPFVRECKKQCLQALVNPDVPLADSSAAGKLLTADGRYYDYDGKLARRVHAGSTVPPRLSHVSGARVHQ